MARPKFTQAGVPRVCNGSHILKDSPQFFTKELSSQWLFYFRAERMIGQFMVLTAQPLHPIKLPGMQEKRPFTSLAIQLEYEDPPVLAQYLIKAHGLSFGSTILDHGRSARVLSVGFDRERFRADPCFSIQHRTLDQFHP